MFWRSVCVTRPQLKSSDFSDVFTGRLTNEITPTSLVSGYLELPHLKRIDFPDNDFDLEVQRPLVRL